MGSFVERAVIRGMIPSYLRCYRRLGQTVDGFRRRRRRQFEIFVGPPVEYVIDFRTPSHSGSETQTKRIGQGRR